MKLNDALIENMIDANGNELSLVRKFSEAVKSAKLIADVYMNDHKAFSSPVSLFENTGYLMASVDGRFSFDPAVNVERILVRVHYVGRDEVLFSSNTVNVNKFLDVADYDADINFKLMNVWEGNTSRTPAPDSELRCLETTNFKSVDLEEQPAAYDDVDPEHQPGVPFEVNDFVLVTAENFSDQKEIENSPLHDYFINWPNHAAVQTEWGADWDHTSWPWLVIDYDFDQSYVVEVKYKEDGDEDFRTVYSDTFTETASTFSGESVSRTYALVNVPIDMNMPEYGYNYDGTVGTMPLGEFKVFFTIPETANPEEP